MFELLSFWKTKAFFFFPVEFLKSFAKTPELLNFCPKK